ncbi:MAG: hypothetical protein AB8E82_20230 [Aureispira sp.]
MQRTFYPIVFSSLFFLCFVVNFTQAQATRWYDAVYLKDSSIVYGQVMRYEPTNVLVLKLGNGTIIEYPADQILKIKKEEAEVVIVETINTPESKLPNPLDPIVPKKFYGWLAAGNTFSNRFEDFSMGCSIDLGGGHKFHPALIVGGGIGATTEYIQSIAYVYGSIRGGVLKRSYSPIYQLDIGYGIPLDQQGQYNTLVKLQAPEPSISRRTGGLYTHPAIGFRFASRNTMHTYLLAGCSIQFIRYEGIDWNNFSFQEQAVFIRPSLRVGMVF